MAPVPVCLAVAFVAAVVTKRPDHILLLRLVAAVSAVVVVFVVAVHNPSHSWNSIPVTRTCWVSCLHQSFSAVSSKDLDSVSLLGYWTVMTARADPYPAMARSLEWDSWTRTIVASFATKPMSAAAWWCWYWSGHSESYADW